MESTSTFFYLTVNPSFWTDHSQEIGKREASSSNDTIQLKIYVRIGSTVDYIKSQP